MLTSSSSRERLSYTLLHVQGSVAQCEALGALREHYEHSNDQHGLGMYYILHGDQLVSPPSTSPILLNIELNDGVQEAGHRTGVRDGPGLSSEAQNHIKGRTFGVNGSWGVTVL